jgi:hypothetical protein
MKDEAFSALGPLCIWRDLHQCSDQAQQRLLLWPVSAPQELTKLDMGQSTPRRGVGLMDDESMTGGWLAPEEP